MNIVYHVSKVEEKTKKKNKNNDMIVKSLTKCSIDKQMIKIEDTT